MAGREGIVKPKFSGLSTTLKTPSYADSVWKDFLTTQASTPDKVVKSSMPSTTYKAPKTSTPSSTKSTTTSKGLQSIPTSVTSNAPVETAMESAAAVPVVSGLQNTFNPLYSSGYTGASDPYNAFTEAGYAPNANVLTGSATGSVYTPGMYTENNPEYVAAMNNPITPDSGNWWSNNKDMISGVAEGIKGLSGLANAYLGYKNYGLAKDMFGFEKAATNRAIQNQASEYNTGIQNAGDVGMSLAGNTMNPAQRAAYQQTLDSRKISTAPVG